MFSPVERAAQAAWKPQDIRKPWEWCQDNIVIPNTSPIPGPFRAANSPWVKEVMEVAADKRVSFIAVKCAAQSSKTMTMKCLLCYDIAEDPGPEMYVMANKDDAAEFVRDRFVPVLNNCKPVKDLLLRESKTGFTFRTMPLYFVGAGSPAKLMGKPMKRLKLDEVRNYPKGALDTVLKRVRAFGSLAQVFIISTPDTAGDEMDRAFKRGDQRTIHFPCPQCGSMQQLLFERLMAVHPETGLPCQWGEVPGAREEGKWHFSVLKPAIRFVCPKCQHCISDTPTERKTICRTSQFIRMNPKAEPSDVSFTWNALLPWWVPWIDIVKEFLLAREAIRLGEIQPMKTFVTETLGESWEDRLGVIEDFGYLEARKAEYDYGDVWPEGKRRFMAADPGEKGGEHYWYVIREFGPTGASRLVTHGMARTLAELEQIRKDNGVRDGDACIDSGYRAQQIYRFCLSSRWKAFKGEAREIYFVTRPHPQNAQKRITVRQIWNRSDAVVYNPETHARIGSLPLWLYSDFSTQDLLEEYMHGLIGNWTLPRNTVREYFKHIAAERREQKEDGKGVITTYYHRYGEQGKRDCEKIILVAAIIASALTTPRPAPPSGEQKPDGKPDNSPLIDGRDTDTGQARQA